MSAEIFYEYEGTAYANLTNKCCCSCAFCIRKNGSSVGSAKNLWLSEEPSMDDIIRELDAFGLQNYKELVFCGYGEPTYALNNLIQTASYVKEHYDAVKLRINTNGLGNLINGKNIVPLLEPYIDSISISLNAPDSKKYNELCHPSFEGAYESLLAFTDECIGKIPEITLSVVNVISIEDIEKCRQIAGNKDVNFRIRINS